MSRVTAALIRVRNILAALLLAGLLAQPDPVGAVPAGWELLWSDEFEGDRLDPGKWSQETDCWGGGNRERQCYTGRPGNASVRDGVLTIMARRERTRGLALPRHLRGTAEEAGRMASKPFSSARLTTQGKADWRYGRIAVRARLPEGQGTWPAIWMLPAHDAFGKWAASGEIDIMEAVNLGAPCKACAGGRENHVLGTLHYGGVWPANSFKSAETQMQPSPDGMHIFEIEWSAGRIDWFVDGRLYASQTSATWFTQASGDAPAGAPFDRPFHLILNLAIGGGLPEGRNLRGVSSAGFPKAMVVDWVRIYRCVADRETGKACAAGAKQATHLTKGGAITDAPPRELMTTPANTGRTGD